MYPDPATKSFFPPLSHMVKELATIMVQEAIKLHYAFQESKQKQQKSLSGSKAHLALTNYPLTFEVWIL